MLRHRFWHAITVQVCAGLVSSAFFSYQTACKVFNFDASNSFSRWSMTWRTLISCWILCCFVVLVVGLPPERIGINVKKQPVRHVRWLHLLHQRRASNHNVMTASYTKLRFRRSEEFCSSRLLPRTGRQLPCCLGRNDSCSVRIFGTTCYCDSFCKRNVDSDCCLDYVSYCLRPTLKITTAATPIDLITAVVTSLVSTTTTTTSHLDTGECFFNGKTFKAGDVTKVNCNRCTCESVINGYYQLNCEEHVCLVRPNIVEAINKGGYSWKAANYSFLWGLTQVDGYRLRLGTKQLPKFVSKMNELNIPSWSGPVLKSFDARTKWPGFISESKDQGNCGGSWAFTISSVAGDRLRIQSKGTKNAILSPYYLMSCLTLKSCTAERPDRAWWFLRKRGIVSTSCYSTTTHSCQFHLKKHDSYATCPSGVLIGKSEVYKSSPAYRILPQPNDIKWEIFNNGPVQAVVKVPPDFFTYKSGIYVATSLDNLMDEVPHTALYHSVKVIGWGTEKDDLGVETKYWIAQNSWGTDWGEDGYIRIREGELGIESSVMAAWAYIH